jgi:hypothetical protein
MQPAQLTLSSFAGYRPQARALATEHLQILREMPLILAPIVLREVIAFDWKLPAERHELRDQFTWLGSLTPAQRAKVFEGFSAFRLEAPLESRDWVDDPSGFMETLTAWLWSSHQMDGFRAVAETYTSAASAAYPPPQPSMPRLGIVVLGAQASGSNSRLFRKLRPHGVYLTSIRPDDGMATLIHSAIQRAGSHDSDLRHWYIDGGAAMASPTLTQISYAQLAEPRTQLLRLIQQAIGGGGMGPEELRTLLTRIQPKDVGLDDAAGRAALNRFQLSLLTEGAGTQIFATTFVQWAARECIRRAQPETLLVRYASRQQAQTMNSMLTGAQVTGIDPEGSLVDADMGAYYTWLGLRRLSGAGEMRFLVWFEGHSEALAIGPGLPQGTTSDSHMSMSQVMALLA